MHSGITWMDVPRVRGNKSTIHRLNLELSKSESYKKIFDEMISRGYLKGKIDLSRCNIDSKDISAKRGDTGHDGKHRSKIRTVGAIIPRTRPVSLQHYAMDSLGISSRTALPNCLNAYSTGDLIPVPSVRKEVPNIRRDTADNIFIARSLLAKNIDRLPSIDVFPDSGVGMYGW